MDFPDFCDGRNGKNYVCPLADLTLSGSQQNSRTRIDFDFLDLTTVAKYPWLLIFVIAEQLNFQIKGSPFNEILSSYGHYTPLLRPQSSDLDVSLRQNIESELDNVTEEQIEVFIARISNALSQIKFNKPFRCDFRYFGKNRSSL